MKTSKIIYLDIDGTILNKEYDTNPKLWQLLNKLEQTCIISLVTARPYAYSLHILKHINNDDSIHIFDRGSFISSKTTSHMSICLSSTLVNKVTEILKNEKYCRIGVSSGKYFYANDRYLNEINGYIKNEYFLPIGTQNTIENVNSIWLRDVPKMFENEILGLSNNQVQIRKNNGKNQENVDIFINSKISQKNTFLKFVSESNKCNLVNSIGIGDSAEDTAFLKMVNQSGCPNNASPEVKSIASYISEKCYSDGVIDILNHFF